MYVSYIFIHLPSFTYIYTYFTPQSYVCGNEQLACYQLGRWLGQNTFATRAPGRGDGGHRDPYMGVSKTRGTPKRMVFIMENPY